VWTVVLSAVVPASASAQDEPASASEPQAELTALAGMGIRHASKDASVNPGGIGYDPALQLAFQARGYVWSWLNAAVYHVRASHGINLPRGAAGIDYEGVDMGKALAYSLGARLEPTYQVARGFRAWTSIGVGWGRMSVEKVSVQEADRSYTIGERAGVFVEVPVGVGAAYEILPNWLTVHAEAGVAHLSKQSGKLFDSASYVDSQGSRDTVGPMPTQPLSASFLLGVSAVL